MGHGQRRSHRHTDVQQRNTRGGSDGEHQRQQQHEADFIEQRKAYGEAGQYNGPLDVLATKFVDKGGSDTLCTTAVGQHFTEHGAEAHNQRQTTEGTAYAIFNGDDHFVEGMPCINPTARATRTSAMNPFILKRIINSNKRITPIATMINGIIFPAFNLLWVTSLLLRQLPIVPTEGIGTDYFTPS